MEILLMQEQGNWQVGHGFKNFLSLSFLVCKVKAIIVFNSNSFLGISWRGLPW